MQEYLVLVRIASDEEVYLPGTLIKLADDQAQIHLREGNVALLDHAVAPQPKQVGPVIHKPGKRSKNEGEAQ